MGEKDITEKILISYNDVFADIINVALFNGRQVISEEDLEDEASLSAYKADGKIHEQDRDVAKRWKNGNIRISCLGIENQSESDADMPLRVIGYDGAAYRAQLLAENPSNKRYPVVTLVLYLNHKNPWYGPLRLRDRLEIPPELEPYVSDYGVNLFQVAQLTKEDVSKFRSDFRAVADYYVQRRENKDYQPEPQVLRHVEAVLQLLSIMENDARFYEVVQTGQINKEEPVTMCEVLDRIENRGIEKGIEKGIEQGILLERTQTARRMHDSGFSLEQIATALRTDTDAVSQLL